MQVDVSLRHRILFNKGLRKGCAHRVYSERGENLDMRSVQRVQQEDAFRP